jgi:hypothetical protein
MRIFVRREVARPMQNRMTMTRDPRRTIVRRRADGVAQIQALALPQLSMGALRTIGFGVVGAALLFAALLAAPFWLAFGGRHMAQGRASGREGAAVTDLGHHRR